MLFHLKTYIHVDITKQPKMSPDCKLIISAKIEQKI